MDKLTLIDQFLFKAGECGLPALNMQGAMILDPSKGAFPVTAMGVAEHIAARLSGFAILRKRLMQDHLHIGDIKMVDDPNFDVWDHITFATLPSPGNDIALSRHLGKFSAEHLDSSKPLWRFEIIEGLEGGKIAIVQKLSHATMDGKAAMKVMQTLFDSKPQKLDKLDVIEWPSDELPSSVALLSKAISESAARITSKAPKAVLQVSRLALHSGRSYLYNKFFGDDGAVAGPKKTRAKRTSLNTEISIDRRNVDFISFDLGRLKSLSKRYQCTMNDLCLVIATGAMTNYFREIGESIDFDLQLCMTISTRTSASREHGNELKLAAVNAHNTIEGISDRVAKITADTLIIKNKKPANKGSRAAIDSENLIASISPLLIDIACAGLSATNPWKHFPVLFNTVVTNIPGPLQTIYFCGMPVECQLPIVPLFHTSALSIGVSSMGGHLTVGFHSCGRVVKESNMKHFTRGADMVIAELEHNLSD